jgi:hypothetical protein
MAEDTLDFLKGFQIDDYDLDLGISFVDENPELATTTTATAEVVETISSRVEGIGDLDLKVDQIQSTLSGIKTLLDFDELNIEGKLDQILKKVAEVPESAGGGNPANIAPETVEKIDKIIEIMGDPEARKAEVERRLQEAIDNQNEIVNGKLSEVEKLILPLLVNLIKPESLSQKYIYWPSRKEVIERQIKKIIQVTRGDVVG